MFERDHLKGLRILSAAILSVMILDGLRRLACYKCNFFVPDVAVAVLTLWLSMLVRSDITVRRLGWCCSADGSDDVISFLGTRRGIYSGSKIVCTHIVAGFWGPAI